MTQPLTEDEQKVLKEAAFGAVVLVSNADPGVIAMFKESFAASTALASSTGVVRKALTSGGIPHLPNASPIEVEASVLPALERSIEILRAKAPAEVDGFRATVLAACEQVAAAASGVEPGESAEIDKIRTALGQGR